MRRQRFQIHSALGAAVPEARFYLSGPRRRMRDSGSVGFEDRDSIATVSADEASYLELDLGRELDEPTLVEAPDDPTAVQPEMPDVPVIPGYVIDRVLGDGASARVYRAWHAPSQRTVALKLMHAFLVDDEVAHARFLREGEYLARLRHPSIVEVYEVGCLDDGRAYLAMELVTGPTLKQLLAAEGPMPPARVLGFIQQLAQALVTVHAAGIVHRDLKLTNVAVVGLTGRERLKLLDFGLVHEVTQEGTRLTKVGVLLGSPAFMPPEQIEAPSTADQRADLYALGIMAYALLSGRVPFAGDKLDILRAQIGTEVPRLPPLGGVEQVVHQLLHKDPALRTSTASLLLQQIQQLLPRPSRPALVHPPPSSTSSVLVRPVRRGPSRWQHLALGFAVLFSLASSAAVGGRLWLDERDGVLDYRGSPPPAVIVADAAEPVCIDDSPGPVSDAFLSRPEPAVERPEQKLNRVPAAVAARLPVVRVEPRRLQSVPSPAPDPSARSRDPALDVRSRAAARLAEVLSILNDLARRTDASVDVQDLETRYLELRAVVSQAETPEAIEALSSSIERLKSACILRAALLAGFDELDPARADP